MPGLAANEDSAHWPGVADRGFGAAANHLRQREVGKVRSVPLARMHDEQTGLTPCLEQPAVRLDRASQPRNIVAEHFPKAAPLEKVPLHVDDEKTRMCGVEIELVGLCSYGRHQVAPSRVVGLAISVPIRPLSASTSAPTKSASVFAQTPSDLR